MRHLPLLFAFAATAASADEPPADPPERGLAISVGTGPQPLNTLTLGATGLAGRVLLPTSAGSMFLSGGHSSVRTNNFRAGDFRDRDTSRGGATTFMLGYRGGAPLDRPGMVPYGVGGFVLGHATVKNGQPGDIDGTGGWGMGGHVGVGTDAFLAPHVSLGAEFGGMAIIALGGEGFPTGGTLYQAVALSTIASAQLTVWR